MNGFDYVETSGKDGTYKMTVNWNQVSFSAKTPEQYFFVQVNFEEAIQLIFSEATIGERKVTYNSVFRDNYDVDWPPCFEWIEDDKLMEAIVPLQFDDQCRQALITIAAKRSNSCEKLAKLAQETISELDMGEF